MKVRGVRELKQKLRRMPKVARTEIKGSLQKSAEEMVSTAKALVPVKSGNLQRSISYTFGDYQAENANVRGVSGGSGVLNDADLTVTIHAGDATAFYAAFVEFGHGGGVAGGKFKGARIPPQPPQPYFFPSWRLTRKRASGRISRATAKAAKKVASS